MRPPQSPRRPRRRRPRLPIWVLLALFALLFIACKESPPPASKSSAPAPDVASPPAPDVASPLAPDVASSPAPDGVVEKDTALPSPPSGPPLLEESAALRLLPAETLVVALGEGVRSLMMRVGRHELEAQTRFSAVFEKLTRAIRQAFGYELFNPIRLAEMGIDVERPFGVAWLDLEALTIASFVAVTDPAAFEAALAPLITEAGWPPLTPVALEGAAADVKLLLSPPVEGGISDRLSIVLRGGLAFVILNDDEGLTHSKRIATLAPADAFGNTPVFTRVARDLASGRHAAAVINVAALQQALRRAHEGAPLTNRDRLLDALATGVQLVVAGIDIDEQMLRLNVHIHHSDEAIAGHFLRNRAGDQPLLQRAVESPPLLMLTGQLQPAGAMRVFELIAEFAGINVEGVFASMREHMGIDARVDLVPLLSGEAGLALTGDIESLLESMSLDAALDALHLSLVVGLEDGTKMQALLSKMAAQPRLIGLLLSEDAALGRFSLPIPGWKNLTLKVVGERLVMSSDPTLLARLEAGVETEGFHGKLHHLQLKALLSLQDTALFALLDHRWIGSILLLEYRERPLDALPEPDALDPLPDGYREKWEKLAATRATLTPLLASKHQALERRALSQLKPLGNLALRMQVEPGVVRFEGGLFFDGENLPAIVEALFELSWDYVTRLRAGFSDEDRTLRKLRRTRDKLHRELKAMLAPPATP